MRTSKLIVLSLAVMATASAPPPPPGPVWKAGEILSTRDGLDPAKAGPLFADDVRAYESGRLIANGKRAWLAWRAARLARYDGRTIGYSESSAGYGVAKGGELLVIDTYETVDRTRMPAHVIADPRMATRSTLYEFGSDGLIHVVRIERTGGFWMTPRGGG